MRYELPKSRGEWHGLMKRLSNDHEGVSRMFRRIWKKQIDSKRLNDIEDSIYCHDNRLTAIEKQLDDMAENEFWCTDRSKACTAAPRKALAERVDILERSLDDLTTGLSQADKPDPIHVYHDEEGNIIDPPEAEQKAEIHRCLDCGAEIDIDYDDGAFFVVCAELGVTHTIGPMHETEAEAIAAYNRLVEDRAIAERARAELNTEINGNIRHVLDYIVKGGE